MAASSSATTSTSSTESGSGSTVDVTTLLFVHPPLSISAFGSQLKTHLQLPVLPSSPAHTIPHHSTPFHPHPIASPLPCLPSINDDMIGRSSRWYGMGTIIEKCTTDSY
jgi:hypothetical protein